MNRVAGAPRRRRRPVSLETVYAAETADSAAHSAAFIALQSLMFAYMTATIARLGDKGHPGFSRPATFALPLIAVVFLTWSALFHVDGAHRAASITELKSVVAEEYTRAAARAELWSGRAARCVWASPLAIYFGYVYLVFDHLGSGWGRWVFVGIYVSLAFPAAKYTHLSLRGRRELHEMLRQRRGLKLLARRGASHARRWRRAVPTATTEHAAVAPLR